MQKGIVFFEVKDFDATAFAFAVDGFLEDDGALIAVLFGC